MTRETLQNWIDRPSQETMAGSDILADAPVTVYVLRSQIYQDEATAGFSDEVAPQTNYQRITIRLDRPDDKDASHDYVGLAETRDIKKDDLLLFTPNQEGQERLRVLSIDKDMNGYRRVLLKYERI